LIQDKGIFFVFEVPGIILAQFATIAGLATRLMKASLDEISPRYESVARSLGSSSWQAFYRVTLPLSFKGLLAAVILSWAKAVGEFAFGINPKAASLEEFLETEKIIETVHIAFGHNLDMPGGKNPSANHMDFLISKPTVTITNNRGETATISKNGKFQTE
jgi:hypothetical protein